MELAARPRGSATAPQQLRPPLDCRRADRAILASHVASGDAKIRQQESADLRDELLHAAEQVAARLRERRETVAVAESSAGGLITAALLAVPNASSYCMGGIVLYTRQSWRALRDFDEGIFGGFRSGTETHALIRARIARDRFGAAWGIGETGATGPTGNRYGDPAGHACIAVAGRQERVKTLRTGADDRVANMHAFAIAALALLEESLA